MQLSQAQLKGRIKSMAKMNQADPRILIRIYMMERFLERVSMSRYKNNFIIKGGILVTSLIGIALRSTMDIDTTLKNLNLSEEDIRVVIQEICSINLEDNVKFQLKEISHIMDDLEYPGIRVTLNAFLEKMPVPMKIDISTGDIITPREIQYSYKLLLEDRSIPLWTYNLETLLAEKLQTILARGTLNTRMRDFYDLYELTQTLPDKISISTLKKAFAATCRKRSTSILLSSGRTILEKLQKDKYLPKLWNGYQRKYSYAAGITYSEVIQSAMALFEMACSEN
mgnify:CR=1 FL=1